YSSSCPAGWTNAMQVMSAVQAWIDYSASGGASGFANNGIFMSGDESDIGGWKKFASAEAGFPASLQVTYNQPAPMTNPGTPAYGSQVITTTPTLSVSPVTDPQNDPVAYWFRVSTGSDADSGNIVAESGWM